MPDFVSFPLFEFTLVIKLRNYEFESHSNTMIFLTIKYMTSMSHGKVSDFISFTLFGFTLFIKRRNFDFESHSNTLIVFRKKKYGIRSQI